MSTRCVPFAALHTFQAFRGGKRCSVAAPRDAILASGYPIFATVTMAPTQRRTPGLILRGGVWHIDKVIYRKRICESTGTRDLAEAQALLARRVTQARQVHLFGEQREHTFREAASKFLAEHQHKRSLERDERALAFFDPFIGALPLQRVHHDTLAPYIRSRLDKGRSPGTINRDLAVVRRILTRWRSARIDRKSF